MQRFAQLRSPEFFDVTVLVSNENKDAAHYYLNGAEAYLKANGFESVQKEWTALDIIDAFKDKYYDLADLIVIGMHSKKGLFDFLLGSLSKYVIEKAEKAVLLGQ